MNAQRFCDWLQGYVEINGTAPTDQQWEIIKDHLNLVFDKVTPNRDNGVKKPVVAQDQLARTEYPYTLPTRYIPIDWSKVSPGLTQGPIC